MWKYAISILQVEEERSVLEQLWKLVAKLNSPPTSAKLAPDLLTAGILGIACERRTPGFLEVQQRDFGCCGG